MANKKIAQLENIKASFEHSPMPFALLDSCFNPYFANEALLSAFPCLKDPVSFAMIFADVDTKTIKNYLLADGAYTLYHDMPQKQRTKFILTALFDEEKNFSGVSVFADASSSDAIFSDGESFLKAQDINHEFQDRLSMMFSCIYALSRSTDLDASTAVCEYINNMNQNCFQLLRVSNNLSKFLSLAESGDCTNLRLADFSQIVKKLADTVVLMDNKNKIPITYDITSEVLPVLTDVSRIEFIFANLILNSIKYTRKGNRIKIELKRIANNAVLSIIDKGAGIPKDILSQVGTPYFSYSHDDKFESGIGLGVYISQKYVASLGGTFLMQSAEGEGTTVTVSFPLNFDAAENETTVNAPPVLKPHEKFSQTAVQLSEVCFYPEL